MSQTTKSQSTQTVGNKSKGTILVIDGNSLAHRAFYAIPLLSNSEGMITNAAYGFTTMLLKILKERRPELVGVAFDKGKITFRHDRYKDYKGNRKATPEELRPQFLLLKDILKAMQIPIFEIEKYEADDIIGAISKKAEESGLNCLVLTGDRDALQLVSNQTKVLYTKKGITQLKEYDIENVEKKFGVTPQQFADYKGLMGDPSDNIPGVPGIGPKTASKLLQEYKSIEELLDNKEKLPTRWRNKLKEYEDQARLSKELATILREIPLDIEIESCYWKGPDYQELLKIFSRLEFKSLIKNIVEEIDQKPAKNKKEPLASLKTYTAQFVNVKSSQGLNGLNGLKELKDKIKDGGKISLVLDNQSNSTLAAAAITIYPEQNFYLSLNNNDNLALFKSICSNPDIKKYCHAAKKLIRRLAEYDIPFAGLEFDTMMAAYLLNPGYNALGLPDLALQHLNIVLPAPEGEDLTATSESVLNVAKILKERLKEENLYRLYYDVELPLITILAEMEIAGISTDASGLKSMSLNLKEQINNIAAEIHSLAGEKFNINSPRQLGQILFEKLGLPVVKRTKTGFSTDAGVLEELMGSHPIIEKVIVYRQLAKLKSTYVDGLSKLINPKTSRLHTTFHQAITATGRLSSAEPNLQNIPIRLEQGRKIRKIFIPQDPNNLILTADYSQIELRILAHMSGDTVLQEAFYQKQDIHTKTASEVFGVSIDEVTKDMRNRAKAVNFGIIYGMSEFGLSRDIKVSRAEAKQYIESYFARYTGVKQYIEKTIAQAREQGYVTTILNRKRYLPDLFSPNHNVRSFGERAAINTPIQGSAADIIKLAMVKTHRAISTNGLQAKMILQVHDELIFDVPENELSKLIKLVRECMENVMDLDVPLAVDIKVGTNWYDVEKI